MYLFGLRQVKLWMLTKEKCQHWVIIIWIRMTSSLHCYYTIKNYVFVMRTWANVQYTIPCVPSQNLVKPVLMTTCILKDNSVMSEQLQYFCSFKPLLNDHLYTRTTFCGPTCSRLIQVSLQLDHTLSSSYIWICLLNRIF